MPTKQDLTTKKIIPIFDALNLTCGECLYFNKLPKGKECCSKQGIRSFATASSMCFQPDFTQVAQNIDQFAAFSALMQTFNQSQAKIALSILASTHKTRDKKFPFGTKVWIKPAGKDYLNNYMSAFVVGYISSEQMVISGNPTRGTTQGKTFVGYVHPDTCLDVVEWEKKKEELTTKGLIDDPSMKVKPHTTVEDYTPEVPTIDNAPRGEEELESVKVKRKRLDVFDFLSRTTAD